MSEDEKLNYPGILLKEARKKKRRRFRKLSSELGIPEKYLQALEENNFSIMAGPTYIRGYLRAYSKKLDLDPTLVLRSYERYLRETRKKEKRSEKKENKKNKKNKKFFLILSLIIVVLLFLIVLFIFLPDKKTENLNNRMSDPIHKIDTKILKGNNLDLAISLEKPAKEINLKTKKLISEENLTSSLGDDLDNEREKIQDINTIRIDFLGDCWVEIMDNKSVLEYKLAKAGSQIYLEGQGPFKILFGHSKRARLIYNGKQVSLASTTNGKTNVSCLVLPKGRCNEFALSY